MSSTLTSLSLLNRQIAATQQTQTSGNIAIEAEVNYWRNTIKTVTTVEQFVNDERLYNFVTKAFGYGDDEAPLPVLAQLAFEGGTIDPGSYANTRVDPRLEEMVREFAFAEFGVSIVRDPVFITNIEQRYRSAATAEANFRAETPRTIVTDQAKREADYFRTRIESIDSVDEFMADFQLYNYALEAFDLKEYASNPFQVRQVLAEGVGQDTDLANVLGDTDLQAFARTFGFDNTTSPNTTDPTLADNIINRHQRTTGTIQTISQEGESRETEYFRENIGKISTAEEFLADRRLYTYVMTAFDLSDQIDQLGIIRKVLEEGTADEDDFTNRLPDPRYRALAKVMGFAEFGARNVQDTDVIDQIATRFETVQREIDAGQSNPTVELAAYFNRKAEGITQWIQVLADSRLRSVVFTTLDMPQSFNVLSNSKLIAEMESRYDIADFQDPEKVEKFVQRFAITSDTQTGTFSSTNSGANAALTLLQSSGTASAQNLYSVVTQL